MEIKLEDFDQYSIGNNSAIIAVGQDGTGKVFVGDKEEVCLLTIRRAAVGIDADITYLTDEPCDAHQSTRASRCLRDAHCFETLASDDVLFSVAHMEACVLQQIADGAHDSSHAITCSADCPGTRHLDVSFH